jgi:multiple sugar transport system ATP-binding protein
MMASVQLKNVQKVYDGGVVAVHNMSLEVADKEFVVLVGPSGCGKTTTLRMIAGLEEVSSGEIFIDGKCVNDISPKDRDIAMVFQNYALYPHMTVYENMAFGLKLRGMRKEEIRRRVSETAGILGIEELLERKPKALSGGQRQRVAVGRAIVRKPKVFLFDEPLSNLDAKLRVQMRTEISKLHQQLSATMIYVTHDQTEAMTMADTIVLMQDGYVRQIDEPLKIYNFPRSRFVAGFIGSPSMNFIEGRIEKVDGFEFVPTKTQMRLPLHSKDHANHVPYVGKDVVMGVRPEHIHIATQRISATGQFDARVELCEPLGNEVLLYFSLFEGGQQYVARTEADTCARKGDTARLMCDMSRVHFFNQESGEVIGEGHSGQ